MDHGGFPLILSAHHVPDREQCHLFFLRSPTRAVRESIQYSKMERVVRGPDEAGEFSRDIHSGFVVLRGPRALSQRRRHKRSCSQVEDYEVLIPKQVEHCAWTAGRVVQR